MVKAMPLVSDIYEDLITVVWNNPYNIYISLTYSKWNLSILTSICILRWVLKSDSSARNRDKLSWNTCGTEDTPFFDNATHRYCLIALMNISFVLNTWPAFCRHARSNSKERILERSSWDLGNMYNCFISYSTIWGMQLFFVFHNSMKK